MARIACTHFVPAAMSRRHHHPFFTSAAAFLTSTTTQSLRFFHSKKCMSHSHGDGVLILGTRNFSSGSRISMSLRAGIVGLPHVGKSTLFNAVVENGKAQAANFPFRTIEPNVKVVGVPDPVLQVLANIKDALMGYIFGTGRATDVAHCVWKRVIRKGDIVVDATCGNGYDTLAMLKMVQDENAGGFVYGMDIQEDAVKRTLSLLDSALDPTYRQHIKIFTTCHSRIAKVLPENRSVRLVAFNLGYLPGGDKRIITSSHTTLLALEAAKEILASGGLISLVVYVGHPGGREEFDTVHSFASKLPVDDWFCSQIQLPNRPESPVLMFLFKR